MKRVLTAILVLLALPGVCQSFQGTLASLSSPADRLSVVKNSLEIPVWHERDFWPVYEQFLSDDREVAANVWRSLRDLAAPEPGSADDIGAARNYLALRFSELALTKGYYERIGDRFNGLIALQFLQTETLMDMMTTFALYNDSPWKDFRFQPRAIPGDKIYQARENMLKAALGLAGDEGEKFLSIYRRYEIECDELLDGYDIYSLYAGEPTDYTPALARRLGEDLLQVLEREITLKQKYFDEFNSKVGPALAVGFLAWEDYYSVISRMHAWAD